MDETGLKHHRTNYVDEGSDSPSYDFKSDGPPPTMQDPGTRDSQPESGSNSDDHQQNILIRQRATTAFRQRHATRRTRLYFLCSIIVCVGAISFWDVIPCLHYMDKHLIKVQLLLYEQQRVELNVDHDEMRIISQGGPIFSQEQTTYHQVHLHTWGSIVENIVYLFITMYLVFKMPHLRLHILKQKTVEWFNKLCFIGNYSGFRSTIQSTQQLLGENTRIVNDLKVSLETSQEEMKQATQQLMSELNENRNTINQLSNYLVTLQENSSPLVISIKAIQNEIGDLKDSVGQSHEQQMGICEMLSDISNRLDETMNEKQKDEDTASQLDIDLSQLVNYRRGRRFTVPFIDTEGLDRLNEINSSDY